MSLVVLGHNVQGLIAASLVAQSGAPVTVLAFPDDEANHVTHIPFALPKDTIDALGLNNHGFITPEPISNPFLKLPFYDGLKKVLDMMVSLDIHRPPYDEKGWRDTWATFEVGHILSQYDHAIQDLFARSATLSLVELLDAANLATEDKEAIMQACLCGSKTDPNLKGSAASILPAMAAYDNDDAIIVSGHIDHLVNALKGAAMGFGADIVEGKFIRKISIDDQSIHSVIMDDETEYYGDLIVLDHDPVEIFRLYTPEFSPPAAFMNRIRPDANTKYCVLATVELTRPVSMPFDATKISSELAYTDFKADGGSQYPVLSIAQVSEATYHILAQYFEPDLDNDDAISQAITQSLNTLIPGIKDNIKDITIKPAGSHVGYPSFTGGMPILQMLKIFSGHHALAYDLPLSNAVMAGYGAGACAFPHVAQGGERAATLYQSLQEGGK